MFDEITTPSHDKIAIYLTVDELVYLATVCMKEVNCQFEALYKRCEEQLNKNT
jgi:hypothetical protein